MSFKMQPNGSIPATHTQTAGTENKGEMLCLVGILEREWEERHDHCHVPAKFNKIESC